MICAVAYTGGPFPLAYLGLGEVFVFLFFGLAAVAGTAVYPDRGGDRPGAGDGDPGWGLAVGILIVNNLRDIETDRVAGKETLAVRLGKRNTQYEYGLMLVIAGRRRWCCGRWDGSISGVVITLMWWPFGCRSGTR